MVWLLIVTRIWFLNDSRSVLNSVWLFCSCFCACCLRVCCGVGVVVDIVGSCVRGCVRVCWGVLRWIFIRRLCIRDVVSPG